MVFLKLIKQGSEPATNWDDPPSINPSTEIKVLGSVKM